MSVKKKQKTLLHLLENILVSCFGEFLLNYRFCYLRINQNKTRPMLVKNQNLIMMGDKALKS